MSFHVYVCISPFDKRYVHFSYAHMLQYIPEDPETTFIFQVESTQSWNGRHCVHGGDHYFSQVNSFSILPEAYLEIRVGWGTIRIGGGGKKVVYPALDYWNVSKLNRIWLVYYFLSSIHRDFYLIRLPQFIYRENIWLESFS